MASESKIFEVVSPIKMLIPDCIPDADLESALTFVDKKIDFQIQRLQNSQFLAWKLGPKGLQEAIDNLKRQQKRCLLFKDKNGKRYTYPSLFQKLSVLFGGTVETKLKYPESELIPWKKPPYKEMRPYQKQALQDLINNRHAGVEIATGLGKSFIILNLCKQLGLKAVIMTPSISIAKQIHAEFLEAFGSRYVGAFFDSKKESNKRFVISVAASLARVDKDSKHYEALSSASVFIADESHMCPAKTLEEVCHGLLKDAAWRFFFSGTQLRSDGLGLLLEAITGPIIARMSVKDGVDQGYLSKPSFYMMQTTSPSPFYSRDANEMTRQHFFYNPEVNKMAAKIANKSVELQGHQVLILVDEFEQFAHLLPHLKHEVQFAHGGITSNNAESIPKEFHNSDPTKLVEEFNNKKFPILVGTSCISTGTDIRSVNTIVFLMGGKSEVQIRQSVGRGTRLFEGKDGFRFFDFDVTNVDVMHRHATERSVVYDNIYGPVNVVGR